MISTDTPTKRRLFLHQMHCEEWLVFFDSQLAVRHLLSRRHRLENDGMRSGRASHHTWAAVMKRQTTEIVDFETLNLDKQTGIQNHQHEETVALEEAIRLV